MKTQKEQAQLPFGIVLHFTISCKQQRNPMPGYHIYCEYYEKSLPYFWTVLDELISDIVIVWGRKVWGYLPIEGLVSSMTVLIEDSVVSLLFSLI